jgi:hypothetical protein
MRKQSPATVHFLTKHFKLKYYAVDLLRAPDMMATEPFAASHALVLHCGWLRLVGSGDQALDGPVRIGHEKW